MNTRITFGTRNIEETLLKDTRDNEHRKSTIVRNIEKTLSKRYCTLMKNKHRWKGIPTLPTHLFQRP